MDQNTKTTFVGIRVPETFTWLRVCVSPTSSEPLSIRRNSASLTTIVILLGCLIHSSATGQLVQRSEYGGGIGVFNYTGDLARNFDFRNVKPAATLFYRANISKVVSFRTSMTGGKLGASDSRPFDPFAARRGQSFNIFVLELSGVYEYHFLDWRDDTRRLRFTPYLFAGLAMFGITGNKSKPAEYSNVQFCIPFGGGLKYVLNPNYYLSLEYGIRKTFFDYLDNVSDGDFSYKNYQYGNPHDYDHYYFVALTLTRTLYDIPCPRSPY